MMEPDAYIPGESPYLEYVYNNESELEEIYWPVYYSQFKYTKDAGVLFNDNTNDYFTYSGGWNNLFVSKEKDGRYKNLSIRAYSGDSFYFYVGAGSFKDGNSQYYAGPLTSSGVYSVLTQYSGEADAIANKVLFTSPNNNSTVYTLPEISVLNFINLYHHEAVSGESYRLYQFLPRTLIQVDDLEAEVIDAVTVRVSDSIVVTADSFADNSILGRKIREGTVSGTLITPGTITTNLIAVSGIDADRINVTTLSALATNTGSLNVTGTIMVSGVSSEIDAGFTKITQSGITVGDFDTELTETNTIKIYGKVPLDGGNVVGLAIYNDSNPSTPHAIFQTDFTNTLEIENLAPIGITNINIPQGSFENSFNVWVVDGVLMNASPSLYSAQFSVGSEYADVRVPMYAWGGAGTQGNAIMEYTGFRITDSNEYNRFLVSNNTIQTRDSANSITFSVNSTNGIVSASSFQASATDSVSTPGHSWGADTDTGMYRSSENTISFATGGVLAMRLSSANTLSINTTNTNGQLTIEVPDGTSRTVMALRQLNDASTFINYVGNSSAGTTTPISTSALGAYQGRIRVAINGTSRWIPFYN